MKLSRMVLRAMVTGSLIVGTATSWIAPKVIAWWFEPPVSLGFSCRTPIEYALSRLQTAQLIGILAGALGGAVLYGVFRPKSHQS